MNKEYKLYNRLLPTVSFKKEFHENEHKENQKCFVPLFLK